jgi:hypothetical protein
MPTKFTERTEALGKYRVSVASIGALAIGIAVLVVSQGSGDLTRAQSAGTAAWNTRLADIAAQDQRAAARDAAAQAAFARSVARETASQYRQDQVMAAQAGEGSIPASVVAVASSVPATLERARAVVIPRASPAGVATSEAFAATAKSPPGSSGTGTTGSSRRSGVVNAPIAVAGPTGVTRVSSVSVPATPGLSRDASSPTMTVRGNATDTTGSSSTVSTSTRPYTASPQGNMLSSAASSAEQAMATDTTGATLVPYIQAGVYPSSVISAGGISNVLTVTALQALGFTEATDPTGAMFWVGPNQIGNPAFTPVN